MTWMTWSSLRIRLVGSYNVGFEFAVEYQNIPRSEGAFMVGAGYFQTSSTRLIEIEGHTVPRRILCKVTGYVHLLTLLWEKRHG